MAGTVDIGNLQARLTMDKSGFDKGLSGANTGIGGLSSKISALAVPIAAVGAAFATIGVAAAKAADETDKAYNTIRIGTGATGAALKDLQTQFDDLRGEVVGDVGDIATAIADLNTRTGLTGDNLENAAKQFLNLSRITKTSVATNIKSVTRLFGDFSVATKDQADTLDYLFRTAQATGATVDTLASKTTQYGTSLRAMGFDLKTSIALLGKFEKEGVNTETILASLKIGMANMARDGVTNANEAFTKLIDEIKSAPSDIDATAKAIEVFGSRAAADMTMAIREGRFEVEDFITTLTESDETINQVAEDTLTLGDKFSLFSDKVNEKLVPLGNTLINAATTILDTIDGLMSEYDTKMEAALVSHGVQMDRLAEKEAETAEKLRPIWEGIWSWLIDRQVENDIKRLDQQAVFADILTGDTEALRDDLISLAKSTFDSIFGVFGVSFYDILMATAEFINSLNKWFADGLNAVLGTVFSVFNEIIRGLNSVSSAMNSVLDTNLPQIATLTTPKVEAKAIEFDYEALAGAGIMSSEAMQRKQNAQMYAAAQGATGTGAGSAGGATTGTGTTGSTSAAVAAEAQKTALEEYQDQILQLQADIAAGLIETTLSESQLNKYFEQALQTTSVPIKIGQDSFITANLPSAEAYAASSLIARSSVDLRDYSAVQAPGAVTVNVYNPEPEPISKTTKTIKRDLASQAAGV